MGADGAVWASRVPEVKRNNRNRPAAFLGDSIIQMKVGKSHDLTALPFVPKLSVPGFTAQTQTALQTCYGLYLPLIDMDIEQYFWNCLQGQRATLIFLSDLELKTAKIFVWSRCQVESL